MNNNNFENIPRPKYIKEYKKPEAFFKSGRYGEMSFLNKLLMQSFISLITIASIFLINKINISFTNAISDGIKATINWNMNFSKAFGTFKNIGDIISDAKESAEIVEASFIMPVDGKITSEYGERVHPVFKTVNVHNGIDIDAKIGTPIRSSADGRVAEVGEDETNGKYIRVRSGKYEAVYAHCYKIIVKEGQNVTQGEVLGETGDTGIVSGPHLHFEILKDGKPVSPTELITGY